jgi:hypothetical protein
VRLTGVPSILLWWLFAGVKLTLFGGGAWKRRHVRASHMSGFSLGHPAILEAAVALPEGAHVRPGSHRDTEDGMFMTLRNATDLCMVLRATSNTMGNTRLNATTNNAGTFLGAATPTATKKRSTAVWPAFG